MAQRGQNTKAVPWRLLQSSSDDDVIDDESLLREERSRRRMKMVRSLQDAFYKSSPNDPSSPCSLAAGRDVISNLPLYRRFGQTEFPGRSTLIYVADPKNTHMFESIVREQSEPFLVGQLNLPGEGSHYDDFGALRGWRDRAASLDGGVGEGTGGLEEVELVGTVLRIVDYRRMADGRMVLLVHGLERFVVETPSREKPYPIADVRILPDTECTDAAIMAGRSRMQARAGALEEALLEDDCSVRLPGDASGGEFSIEDMIGVDMQRIMPLAPFLASCTSEEDAGDSVLQEEEDNGDLADGNSLSVENELVHYGILQEFPSFTNEDNNGPDVLERLLWSRINEYARIRNIKCGDLPRKLLALLPPEAVDWPEASTLWRHVTGSNMAPHRDDGNTSTMHRPHRRQRRLAYASTVLLGGTGQSTGLLNRGMRQKLLVVPSTRGRLWAAIECFDQFLQLPIKY